MSGSPFLQPASSPSFGSAIRDQFFLRRDITFLNNGSFGATPKKVIHAQRQWQEMFEEQPVEFVKRKLSPTLRAAANRMATFMHADAQDLVFVENASTGISCVLHSMIPKLKPGDELLTTTHVYNAVRQTMLHICSLTGARVVEADVPFPLSSAELVRERLLESMTERTRLVVVDHVTSPSGLVFPVADIIRDCHERGILVLIDGAHAPGMLDLNLSALDADWYCGNFHKWLFAPKGSAFLWTRRDHQSWTHPVVPSHGYKKSFLEEFDYWGTKDWSAYFCAVDGLEFFEALGADAVRSYNNSLAIEARDLMLRVVPQETPCPVDMLASLATILLPIQSNDAFNEAEALHDRLWDEFRIEVPVMLVGTQLMLRIAAQVFNERGDYEVLCEAMPKVFGHA